jgi:glycosyltransferase involved in cell wall biosynthesis
MVKKSDYITTTTLPLAKQLMHVNQNVSVIRNYPLPFTKSTSFNLRHLKRNSKKFVIGYYPGTLTHQADFNQCASALAKFLRINDNAEFRVVGRLNLDEFHVFNNLNSQIVRLPLMAYEDMIIDLAGCHVNIAPLEIGNIFCECKSELKYFDAAMMGVPTIASPTIPFKMAIQHGVNGFLAKTEVNWFDCFQMLFSNEIYLNSISLNARRYALANFGEAAQLSEYKSFALSILNSS